MKTVHITYSSTRIIESQSVSVELSNAKSTQPHRQPAPSDQNLAPIQELVQNHTSHKR